MQHTVESLTAFTARVKQAFLDKRVPGPVHLCSDTQAQPLIDIFKDIRPQDWVFSTWRSSFHALLKGIPEEEVFSQILEGRSMYLSSREYRFYCSSIVGGILPIALGVAAGIKREREDCQICKVSAIERAMHNHGDAKVWVFIGDMTETTGLANEFVRYAQGHELPIVLVTEDNGLSTNARTRQTWGVSSVPMMLGSYRYDRTHPHVGVGQKVQF